MIAAMNMPLVAGVAPRACKAAAPAGVSVRTYMQDVVIKRKTGMPQVARGPYGLGRYVV